MRGILANKGKSCKGERENYEGEGSGDIALKEGRLGNGKLATGKDDEIRDCGGGEAFEGGWGGRQVLYKGCVKWKCGCRYVLNEKDGSRHTKRKTTMRCYAVLPANFRYQLKCAKRFRIENTEKVYR